MKSTEAATTASSLLASLRPIRVGRLVVWVFAVISLDWTRATIRVEVTLS
jgi:hypothetical protein